MSSSSTVTLISDHYYWIDGYVKHNQPGALLGRAAVIEIVLQHIPAIVTMTANRLERIARVQRAIYDGQPTIKVELSYAIAAHLAMKSSSLPVHQRPATLSLVLALIIDEAMNQNFDPYVRESTNHE